MIKAKELPCGGPGAPRTAGLLTRWTPRGGCLGDTGWKPVPRRIASLQLVAQASGLCLPPHFQALEEFSNLFSNPWKTVGAIHLKPAY